MVVDKTVAGPVDHALGDGIQNVFVRGAVDGVHAEQPCCFLKETVAVQGAKVAPYITVSRSGVLHEAKVCSFVHDVFLIGLRGTCGFDTCR